MVTLWLLPCYRLFTSWLLPSYYLAAACLLPGYCLIISWLLPCYCVVTSWLLPSYCLVTAGYFLVTTWLLVTSWLQPGYFLVVRFAERRNLFLLSVCQHISTGLYRFAQCSSARFYNLLFCQLRGKSGLLREPKIHHRIRNSPHIYEYIVW